jgi:hypothetical protein
VDYEVTERKTLQQGCATTLIAALDPTLESKSQHFWTTGHYSNYAIIHLEFSGSYLSDGQLKQQAEHARGATNAEKLWHLAEHLLGQKFDL